MEFAKTQGISPAEAAQAFADSAPLYDFTLQNAKDSRFGAVWATYDGGYKVHLRYLDPSFLDVLADLASKLGAPVDLRVGGASAAELNDVAQTLQDAKSRVAYSLNLPEGTLDLHEGSSLAPGLIDAAYVRTIPAPRPAAGDRFAAADVWNYDGSNWAAVCTAGFMYKGPSISGYATAGHCPDGGLSRGWVDGIYSAWSNPFQEQCANTGGDYQLVNFDGGFTLVQNRAFDKRSYPHPLISFAIAGGYYIGQPTLKMGLFANGAVGSNTGTVTGFGNKAELATGDCPAGTYTGLQYNNLSAGGDSGGPILLSYANQWFLGATHAIGGENGPGQPGTRQGTWIGWIPLPGGYHICTVSNPCN